MLAAGSTFAEQPRRSDSGNARKSEHMDRRDKQRGERHERDSRYGKNHRHFDDQHRVMVRNYYEEQFRHGHCPDGLAKKHNGCMPREHERKWRIGRPLPREVIVYNLPQRVVVELGPPPSGYRYVRVASDILLIAAGTGMVIDAIEDLGGEQHERDSRYGENHRHFDDRYRVMVRNYYEEQFRHGHCPYGLAMKHNGCMPRGHERKWRIGRPLPREVIYYDLPQRVEVELGPPPSGYRYVRVASDILMIAAGTGMVIDAINDLGR